MTSTVTHHEAGGDGLAPDRGPFRDGVTVGLVTVIVGALGVMAVVGEVFVDALVFLVVFAGLGWWAARSASSRLRWVIAALVTLFVGINLVFAIPDLSHPESPGPFIATAVVILGGVVTVVLAVLAARGRTVSARRVWAVAFAALGVAAVGSLVAGAAVQDDAVQPGDVSLVAEDFEFPEELDLGPSSSAIAVRNADRARHTFVIEDEVPAVEVPAGSTVRVEVDLAPGSYRYYCDVAGHEAMEGTLRVG